MYRFWIREIEGKERVIIAGIARTVKEVNYIYRGVDNIHHTATVLEYEMLDDARIRSLL